MVSFSPLLISGPLDQQEVVDGVDRTAAVARVDRCLYSRIADSHAEGRIRCHVQRATKSKRADRGGGVARRGGVAVVHGQRPGYPPVSRQAGGGSHGDRPGARAGIRAGLAIHENGTGIDGGGNGVGIVAVEVQRTGSGIHEAARTTVVVQQDGCNCERGPAVDRERATLIQADIRRGGTAQAALGAGTYPVNEHADDVTQEANVAAVLHVVDRNFCGDGRGLAVIPCNVWPWSCSVRWRGQERDSGFSRVMHAVRVGLQRQGCRRLGEREKCILRCSNVRIRGGWGKLNKIQPKNEAPQLTERQLLGFMHWAWALHLGQDSGRPELNRRLPGPKPGALPG